MSPVRSDRSLGAMSRGFLFAADASARGVVVRYRSRAGWPQKAKLWHHPTGHAQQLELDKGQKPALTKITQSREKHDESNRVDRWQILPRHRVPAATAASAKSLPLRSCGMPFGRPRISRCALKWNTLKQELSYEDDPSAEGR